MPDHLKGWKLMPTPAGTCPECAQVHAPGEPHDAGSMAYMYWFYDQHGRWPCWNDAIAHLTDEGKAIIIECLKANGVDPADPAHARGAPDA